MRFRVYLLISAIISTSSFTSLKLTDSTDKYSVYFFLLDECRICDEYAPELNGMYQEFHSDEIQFVGLFPNFSSKHEAIQEFKEANNIPFELKTDYYKKQTKKLGVTVLPEVVVYDEKNQKVIYKGRIDNRFVSIGKRRQVITKRELIEVLDALKENKKPNTTFTEAIGCFVNFNDNLQGK